MKQNNEIIWKEFYILKIKWTRGIRASNIRRRLFDQTSFLGNYFLKMYYFINFTILEMWNISKQHSRWVGSDNSLFWVSILKAAIIRAQNNSPVKLTFRPGIEKINHNWYLFFIFFEFDTFYKRLWSYVPALLVLQKNESYVDTMYTLLSKTSPPDPNYIFPKIFNGILNF